MRLLTISDIHTEFQADAGVSFVQSLPKDVDVLAVVGDACAYDQMPNFLRLLCDNYPHVLYLWGNHEAYGTSIQAVRNRAFAFEGQIQNLFVLDNNVVEIENQRFIGGTMWFRDDAFNAMFSHQLNDFHHIRDFASHVYKENQATVSFLEENVRQEDIVMTHHLPSYACVSKIYRGSDINRFFVCEMDKLIHVVKPKLWLHGHTHDSVDRMIGDTRVVCNPFGYAGHGLNPNFSADKIIEL